jgi:hypothetical protein
MSEPIERFWAKVRKSDGCWLWTGAKTRGGYGNCYFGGRYMRAHRVSFTLANPDTSIAGLDVDHRCHVPACVRPEHLRAITHKQNQEHRSGAQRNSSSGVQGVRWDGRRWLARVKHHGRTIYVGKFTTKEAAAEAVRRRRIELFTHNDKDYEVA